MPTAVVNEEGIQLSYIDSGLPEGRDTFTTLIIIHGLGWSGGDAHLPSSPEIFQKAVDIAPKYGIRVVALNRRDYEGSSPFTPEELSHFSDEGLFRQFMRNRSLELAGFLKHLIDGGGVSKAADRKGGVVLMGWSMGNVFSLDFVANASTFPEPLKSLVETYVKAYVLFDPSSTCFGLPYIQGGEQQRIMAANPDPVKANDALQDWICGWFSYPQDEQDPVKKYVEPTQHPIRESTWRTEQSNPDFMKCYAGVTTNKNEVAMVRGAHSKTVFTSTSEATMFNKSEQWPGLAIRFVYCENSLWTCVYAGDKTEELWKEKGIDRHIIKLRRANHFLHWEDPENFLKGVIPMLD